MTGAESPVQRETATRRRIVNWTGKDLLLLLALLALPWLLPLVGSYTALGTYILIWALAALGLNLLMGYTGALSFGHAAFLGVGAYGAGLTIKYLAPSSLLALLVAVAAGIVAAMLLGFLVTKLRGIYFATFTIVFSQLFYFIAFQWSGVTGGDDGLRGFSRQPIQLGGFHVDLGPSVNYYYFVLLFFVLAVLLMRHLVTSPMGRSFIALRENVVRARSLGLHVERSLWTSFVISAAFTSLAGGLLALFINFAQTKMLHWTTSGELVMMVFLGGRGSFYGPLVGAALFRLLQEFLSSYTDSWMFFLGGLFVLAVLFFPRGIAGFFERWRA